MVKDIMLSSVIKPFSVAICGLAVIGLVTGGCAGSSKIAKSNKGSVYVEEVSDWSFEASHPAVIDHATLAKVIKGLYSDPMSAGGGRPMRMFSDEDADFLVPLLAQGLAKARPEQIVGFRVSSSAGSGSEPTTGSIYVHHGEIHVAIAQARDISFTPANLARMEQAPSYAASGIGGATAVVIDYHALAKAPMPAALPVAKAAPKEAPAPTAVSQPMAPQAKAQFVANPAASEFQSPMVDSTDKVKETIAKKDSEINMLRKESEWMKRELRERDEEIKALKSINSRVSSKPAPKKKPAHVQPAN